MRLKLELIPPDAWAKLGEQNPKLVLVTIKQTFNEAGAIIKAASRQAIQAGGFSGKFANAFRVNVYPKGGQSGHPAIVGKHKIPWAGQFENPVPVHGKPYIWLPITSNLPGGRQRWSPAKFAKTVGPLRGGRGGGRPILFGQVAVSSTGKVLKLTSARRARKHTAKKWMPVFIGVTSVNDPKRFDTGQVFARVSDAIPDMYSKLWDGV